MSKRQQCICVFIGRYIRLCICHLELAVVKTTATITVTCNRASGYELMASDLGRSNSNE
jgi:hypothetical protein